MEKHITLPLTEELAKTQQGVDEANKGLAGAVRGDNPTTTPPVTNEPTNPPVGDKPEDDTNPNGGDGAAAQIQKEEDFWVLLFLLNGRDDTI